MQWIVVVVEHGVCTYARKSIIGNDIMIVINCEMLAIQAPAPSHKSSSVSNLARLLSPEPVLFAGFTYRVMLLLCSASFRCCSLGFLHDSKALCNFKMFCLPVSMKWDRSNQTPWQGGAKEMCVVERMCVNDKVFTWLMLNISLDQTRFDALLHQWLLARCSTFCERTIMLYVVQEFYASRGNNYVGYFFRASSQHWHSKDLMSSRKHLENVEYDDRTVASGICQNFNNAASNEFAL